MIDKLLLVRFFCTASFVLMLSACDTADTQDAAPIYIVEVSGETFRIKVTDPDVAEAADSLLANNIGKIVHGLLLEGDGGFNMPYSWHLDPATIAFPDLAIELCDGRPSFVENDLDYWLNSVGAYCPWGAQIIGKE